MGERANQGRAPLAQGKEGAVRRETSHRMTRRCADWDYRQRAIYMVTLVQADRSRPLLGRLVIDDTNAPPEAVAARVEPSELGAAVFDHWRRLGDFAPEVKPVFCQLMPDHLHAIVEVTRPMAKPLGNVIGGFKTGCEKIYRKLAQRNRELALSAQNKVSGGSCSAPEALCPVPEARASGLSRLFAPGFQDSVLFRAGQLDAMFAYLRDNPRRLAVKRLYPNLFRVVGELRRPLPSLGGEGAFMALGNRFLLDCPLVQVQVSRRDFTYRREAKRGGGHKIARNAAGEPSVASASASFAAKCEALLAVARQGAVLLSPCVSDGEREVAHRAFAERLPLVVLRNKGFAPLEKPSGRHFDACADGRLLMLAPTAWPHLPGEKPMTRRDALVLNRLAQALCPVPEAPASGDSSAQGSACAVPPLRYHGVTFAEVDDWAREAVRLAPSKRAHDTLNATAAHTPCAPAAPALRPCSVPETLCPVPEALCSVPEAQASGSAVHERLFR